MHTELRELLSRVKPGVNIDKRTSYRHIFQTHTIQAQQKCAHPLLVFSPAKTLLTSFHLHSHEDLLDSTLPAFSQPRYRPACTAD